MAMLDNICIKRIEFFVGFPFLSRGCHCEDDAVRGVQVVGEFAADDDNCIIRSGMVGFPM